MQQECQVILTGSVLSAVHAHFMQPHKNGPKPSKPGLAFLGAQSLQTVARTTTIVCSGVLLVIHVMYNTQPERACLQADHVRFWCSAHCAWLQLLYVPSTISAAPAPALLTTLMQSKLLPYAASCATRGSWLYILQFVVLSWLMCTGPGQLGCCARSCVHVRAHCIAD